MFLAETGCRINVIELVLLLSDQPLATRLGYATITTAFDSSINRALLEEVASYEELDAIEVKTDARHEWRKNAKHSCIVAFGEKSYIVMNCVRITKTNDVSQRREKIGIEKHYTYFDSKYVSINVHTHDRNMTLNKLVKT